MCREGTCEGELPSPTRAASYTAWYFVEALDGQGNTVARAANPLAPLQLSVIERKAWYESPWVYAGGAALVVGAATVFFIASDPRSQAARAVGAAGLTNTREPKDREVAMERELSRKGGVGGLEQLPRRLWDTSPALVAVSALNLGLLVLFLVGCVADPRLVAGQLAWVKPAKFAASIPIYSLTLAWMLSYVEGRRRVVRAIGGVTAAMLVVEIALIALQAARGVRSHFNATTVLDGALFALMGVAIAVAWGCGFVAAGLLLRQRLEDGALAWSMRLGLLLSLLGAGLGGLMTQPSEAQLEALRQGLPAEAGAHSVGVADGGTGLPVLGWSTEGGDLRVPHFFGLHAMQLLPLLGLWLSRGRVGRRLRARARLGLVWASTLAYGGTVLVLTWQALRGEPLLSPGPVTLWALGALAGVTALAVVAALLPPRRLVAAPSGRVAG